MFCKATGCLAQFTWFCYA